MRLLVASYPILRVALAWPPAAEIPLGAAGGGLGLPAAVGHVGRSGWWPVDGPIPNGNGFQAGDATHRPWLCFPGSLEYHEWPGHHTDHWWPRRMQESLRLLGFVQHVGSVLRRTP